MFHLVRQWLSQFSIYFPIHSQNTWFFPVSKLETSSWPISHSRRTISLNLCSNPSNETILVPPWYLSLLVFPPRWSLSFFPRFLLSFIFLNFIIVRYARYERPFQKIRFNARSFHEYYDRTSNGGRRSELEHPRFRCRTFSRISEPACSRYTITDSIGQSSSARFFSNFDCKHVSSSPLWIGLLPGYGNSRGLQPATGLLAHDNDRYPRLADGLDNAWYFENDHWRCDNDSRTAGF